MKEGYWINYRTGKIVEIDEHEQWIRRQGNAKKLGVPPAVEKTFGKFRPVKDRDKFLLFVMQNAPVMRVRGHGGFVTFEYSSHFKSEPMDAVWAWGKENAGPFTQLNIVNFATNESNSVPYQSFDEAMDAGGYDAVMRVATSRVTRVRKVLAKELLAMARELVR